MDRTIERVADPMHANLKGAAILAGLALGDLDAAAASKLVPIAGVFRPNPSHRARYDALYAEFPRLYRAQKAMFSRLNSHPRRAAIR
jgi:xylulokinase